MPDFNIDATHFYNRMDRIVEQYDRDAKQLINDSTASGTQVAKANARVDTGRLRNSIMPKPASKTANGWEGSFGTNVYYSGWQNYGFTLHGAWHDGTHYMEKGKLRAEAVMGDRGRTLLNHIKQDR